MNEKDKDEFIKFAKFLGVKNIEAIIEAKKRDIARHERKLTKKSFEKAFKGKS